MYVAEYLASLRSAEQQLAEALTAVGDRHASYHADVYVESKLLASWSLEHVRKLTPWVEKYGERMSPEPKRLGTTVFTGVRVGGMGYLRDLSDLRLLVGEVFGAYEILLQAARALRDVEFQALLELMSWQAKRQEEWVRTKIHEAAAVVLTVPEPTEALERQTVERVAPPL